MCFFAGKPKKKKKKVEGGKNGTEKITQPFRDKDILGNLVLLEADGLVVELGQTERLHGYKDEEARAKGEKKKKERKRERSQNKKK